MKAKAIHQRGQALILIALAAVGFFGIVGLSIDGSAKFSDRRHAQNAADTAALAGAIARADVMRNHKNNVPGLMLNEIKDAAWARADQNGYDNNKVSNNVQVFWPPATGIYSNCSDVHFDCNDYVQVIIDSTVDTYFARVIGINQTHNHVEAVASTISENNNFNFGGNAVVALAPDGCALMSQGGTNVHIVGGGLYSNSDDSTCSFKKQTCAGVTDVDADPSGTVGTITMVGGASLNAGCLPDAIVQPAGSKQLPFPPPYQEIAPPAACSQPKVSISGNVSAVTLSPGHYGAMPPKPNIKDITLQPGVYCIDTEIRIGSTDSFKVTGAFGTDPGVFLYLMPGGTFTFNGGSVVQIWGIHDPASLYNGFLIYAAPNYASGTPGVCNVNGGSMSMFKGTIYAPYCNITINGGSGPTGFQSQVIGYNVKFAGTSDIYLDYDSSTSPVWTVPMQVGLSK